GPENLAMGPTSKRLALVASALACALSLSPFAFSFPFAFSLVPFPLSVAAQAPTAAAPQYDLLLRVGHFVDARNKIRAVRDVAIAGGKVAAVEAKLNPSDALKTVDVTGLYVTPGLV